MSEGTEPLSIVLQGERFGRFQGATVGNILSGSHHTEAELEAARADLANNLERLIRNGDILWTEPGETPENLFKSTGRPYFGMVKWQDGKMLIERVPIFS